MVLFPTMSLYLNVATTNLFQLLVFLIIVRIVTPQKIFRYFEVMADNKTHLIQILFSYYVQFLCKKDMVNIPILFIK